MKFEYVSSNSIDDREDGFRTVLFVAEDGRHFHAALISKLLSGEAAEKIKDVIGEELNRPMV